MVKLIYPENGSVVSLHTDIQKSYISLGYENVPEEIRVPKEFDGTDRSFPEPVVFSWKSEMPEEFVLWEKCSGKIICKTVALNELAVVNLKINTEYLWTVGDASGWFRTEDIAPRNLRVDGITNVRDLGGRKTLDGKRVRQGLLYRGSELDLRVNITEEGKKTLREELGIKTDLDLRYPDAVKDRTESVLGSDINYIHISIHAYKELFDYKSEVKRIFELLSDPENYPLYFHCYGGADRTGMVALLLYAVLNVSEEDIYIDYEYTSLSIFDYRSRKMDCFAEFLTELNRYGGESLRENAIRFLRDCGISDETFDKIRNILTE